MAAQRRSISAPQMQRSTTTIFQCLAIIRFVTIFPPCFGGHLARHVLIDIVNNMFFEFWHRLIGKPFEGHQQQGCCGQNG